MLQCINTKALFRDRRKSLLNYFRAVIFSAISEIGCSECPHPLLLIKTPPRLTKLNFLAKRIASDRE